MRFALGCSAMVFAVVLAACGDSTAGDGDTPPDDEPAEPVKIGWIGHLTGVLSAYGTEIRQAAELAVEHVNEAGGVDGRMLELVVRDDEGDPSLATTLARELDVREDVAVIAGTMSADVARAVRGYAESNELPYVVSSSGDATITEPGTEWTVRIQPPAPVQGAAMGRFATEQAQGAKVALVRHDILYFPEIMAGARWYVEGDGGGEVVYDRAFSPQQSDFRVIAQQVAQSEPDYVILAFNPPGFENFVMSALDAGLEPDQLILFTVPPAPALEALGEDVLDTYAATFFDQSLRDELPEAGEFADAYYDVHGYHPSYVGAHGYTTILAIAAAVEEAGSTEGAELRAALSEIETPDAAGRTLTFDENGENVINTTYIVQADELADDGFPRFSVASEITFDLGEVPTLELSRGQ